MMLQNQAHQLELAAQGKGAGSSGLSAHQKSNSSSLPASFNVNNHNVTVNSANSQRISHPNKSAMNMHQKGMSDSEMLLMQNDHLSSSK